MKKIGRWRASPAFAPGVAVALVVAILWFSRPQQPVTLAAPTLCGAESRFAYNGLPTLPETRYLYSVTYGWFDLTHLDAGQPRQLIADVARAVAAGGGTLVVSQDVRNDLTGHAARYRIGPGLTSADIIPVAHSIHADWSVRFEAWQGRMPHGLIAALTVFSVEDLPSHYLGFYAAATGLSVEQIFTCYLGNVTGTDEKPPAFALVQEGESGLPRLEMVRNRELRPLVEQPDGRWEPVSWPEALQLPLVPTAPGTWSFVEEQTWYLGDVPSDSDF